LYMIILGNTIEIKLSPWTTTFHINHFELPICFYIVWHWSTALLTFYKSMVFFNLNYLVIPWFFFEVPVYGVDFSRIIHIYF
jgi:hypothetical protein